MGTRYLHLSRWIRRCKAEVTWGSVHIGGTQYFSGNGKWSQYWLRLLRNTVGKMVWNKSVKHEN
jgi:hypothetical protein